MAALTTAYVAVRPDMRGFSRELKSGLRKADATAAGKDSGRQFGGAFGSTAKTMLKGAALLGALTAATGFLKDANAEAREAQKVGATTTQIIKTTGGAAKISAEQVGALATAISNKTGKDDEAIQSGANLLLTFKNVRNETGKGSDIFNRATKAAVDLSATGFGSISGSSKMLGKALQDPVKGITALQRAGVTFSAQQREQIKVMVESGNVLGAQKLIMAEVESQVGGVAAASATAGEKMSVAFGNFKEQVGTALLPVIDGFANLMIGRVFPALSRFVTMLSAQIPAAFKSLRSGFPAATGGFSEIGAVVGKLGRVVVPIIREIADVAVAKFREMRPQIMSVWTSVKEIITGVMFIVKEVIQSVTTIIKLIWDRHGESIKKIIGGAFGAIFKTIAGVMKAIAGVIKLFVALIKGDWRGAWNAIKQIFAGIWQAIKAILGNILNQIHTVIGGALTRILTRWFGFWTRVRTSASDAMNRVFTGIRTVLGRIQGAFQNAKTAIGRVWDGVRAVVSAPINWIKDNVYNRPLVPVWNRVAGLVGGPKLATYASGGVHGVRPGYTPGRDNQVIAVGGGEAIMRPEWTRAAGADYVNSANAAARRGGLGASRRFISSNGVPGSEPMGFAAGGIVGWIKNKIGSAGDLVSGLAAKIKGFVLGSLRTAAGAILNPLKSGIDRAMPNTGIGNTVGGIGKKGIDLLLDKIGSADAAAVAAAGAGGAAGWGGGSFRGLSSSQMNIAATIASVGAAMGKKAQLIGIIAGLVESRLTNVNFGDRDSLGVFQQRAPWGPASVRRNVRASAGMFFRGGRGGQRGLDDIPGWAGMNPGTAAQRVQVSAFPGRYATQIPLGNAILAALAGGGGPAGTGSARRVTWKGGTFTERFRNTLIRAQQLAGTAIPVIQGGFSRRVAASGTSHYGDAIDTRWNSRILAGLRRARVAAWHRTPAQGFSHHIHGVPLPGAGFPGGSGIWQAQDYLRGGNGLALGGIVRGGRGGITTQIGEGSRDELVAPLPRNWRSASAPRSTAGARPINILIDLGDGVAQRVQGILDENDEFHAGIGRMHR